MERQADFQVMEMPGCALTLRRVEGAHGVEYFVGCRPLDASRPAAEQAHALYRSLQTLLEERELGFASVVCEAVFLRDAARDLGPVREARRRVLLGASGAEPRRASLEIEQPPLGGAALELSVHVVAPEGGAMDLQPFGPGGARFTLGGDVFVGAGGIQGTGAEAYDQALCMFQAAETLLEAVDMDFGNVIRTWIHLREMERDYDALNRARRDFFTSRGIVTAPASTGIGGGPADARSDLCLSLLAVDAASRRRARLMSAPTLNEACQYGADFARGMRVAAGGRTALLISGTASVDEAGDTAHVGDFAAQVERMLVNVASLLEGQGASFSDVASAVTYVKRPEDADTLRSELAAAGYEGFPNILVASPICRPELLCETEAIAILPETRGVHDE